MRRWRHRLCTCSHGRHMHDPAPRGCTALRCDCPIWDAAWAARWWARLRRLLTRD